MGSGVDSGADVGKNSKWSGAIPEGIFGKDDQDKLKGDPLGQTEFCRDGNVL